MAPEEGAKRWGSLTAAPSGGEVRSSGPSMHPQRDHDVVSLFMTSSPCSSIVSMTSSAGHAGSAQVDHDIVSLLFILLGDYYCTCTIISASSQRLP